MTKNKLSPFLYGHFKVIGFHVVQNQRVKDNILSMWKLQQIFAVTKKWWNFTNINLKNGNYDNPVKLPVCNLYAIYKWNRQWKEKKSCQLIKKWLIYKARYWWFVDRENTRWRQCRWNANTLRWCIRVCQFL